MTTNVSKKIVIQFNVKLLFVDIKLKRYKQNNIDLHHASLLTNQKIKSFFKNDIIFNSIVI